MALVLKDRVLETCISPGTGTVSLLGAVTGYQAFSTVGNGNTTYYAICDQSGSNWEVGIGTYTLAGTLLARTTILSSSNAGSPTNFATGTQNVFLTYPSSRSVNLNSAALTSGRVTFATTDGLLTDSANLTFNGTILSAAGLSGPLNGTVGATTASTGAFTTLSTSSTTTLSGLTASTALALDASKVIISVTNTGTGNNVLATSPTLVTPALGTPSSGIVTNLTGTASISINGTVGATTPATGVFTTLTTSSTVTLNSGTANGVAFLNGSKVLTTGSALVFDGTNLTTTGLINAKNAFFTGRNAPASGLGMEVFSDSVNGNTLAFNRTLGTYIGAVYDGLTHVFQTSSTEQMRLTSTGLGIGTSGNLNYSARLKVLAPSNQYVAELYGSGGNNTALVALANDGGLAALSSIGSSLAFYSGGLTERMRIDSSGNVGIGTSSPSAKLDVNGNISVGLNVASANTVLKSFTTGHDAGNRGGIIAFGMNDSTFAGMKVTTTAAINPAFNSQFITFDTHEGGVTVGERMRIDSSGNVGIGTTSVDSVFIVNKSGVSAGLRIGFTGASQNFYDADVQFFRAGNGTERMRIDSSGNVGIGTSSPGQVLEVSKNQNTETQVRVVNANASSSARSGFVLGNDANAGAASLFLNSSANTGLGGVNALNVFNGLSAPIAFFTNATERMRIDSSGNMFVNTSNFVPGIGGKINLFYNSATEQAVVIKSTSTTFNGGPFIFVNNANAVSGSISQTQNTINFNTSSDYRLKDTIAPMAGALAKVALLKPCTYKWKSDGADGQGFIAHEVNEVVPGCATGTKDAVDAEGNPVYQGIDTSFLVATLTAAIQEQQALIEALTTRLTFLENK